MRFSISKMDLKEEINERDEVIKYLKEQISEEEDLAVSIKIESFADADMGGLDSNKK